ncbi:DNA-binding GntR family transcriptional regulator [Thermocatellispora tengchongensis]|uniref:DNA-binding GntR family transcriptional regulator n=1 Tax=Thermocatellispora tengchongensis TaxID=1073253 RepID=A0A840PBR9_9ACTN|nr:GntR family transcriptional regulator [Thermocatellispora tengchongensis]MBB5138854.1 DNA-binding GntR family transcriptional regulator [Thermocatellispora tengchongensis]
MSSSFGEEFAPPKYAQIVQAIRARIADGTYPPGSLLPSETQLIREFRVSRPTVVRALQVLQLRGVIDREHGKGSFVRSTPPTPEVGASRPGRAVLDRSEANEGGSLVEARQTPAPAHVAALLGVADKTPVAMRRLVFSDGERPSELVTIWSTLEVADGSDLILPDLLDVGVRHHLQAAKDIRLAHVVERLAARHPNAQEAKLLGVPKSAAVLGLVSSVFNGSGGPVLVVELVLPGELHELEDAYSL